MNKIKILDCTLRDGGYCNQWEFGYENIKKITQGLVDANIDIIECGFLTDRTSYNPQLTRFNTIKQIKSVIPKNKNNKCFVAMINYGELDVNELPDCDKSILDGIRIAFHKKDLLDALKLCKKIKDKGYQVFIQAMVSLSYSDKEFIDLIHEVNAINPEAFYIVDSFGMMKEKDLTRLFYLVENNLSKNIWIGFHSHNNMQLAYANAQKLVTMQTNRDLIIDATIYGMGRGAGNLNTELFVDYLNENIGTAYVLKPLLTIIDEILNNFYQQNYWGYSLPNYLAATHNVHPSYAGYLDDKKTLTIESMNEIFEVMKDEKKVSFDKKYIETLYYQYMGKEKVHKGHLSELESRLCKKKILLIAPGKSSLVERKKIEKFVMDEDVVTISVNLEYEYVPSDYIFLSNMRRYKELNKESLSKCIVTSNILVPEAYLQIDYNTLLNNDEAVRDNAGLMAVRFLIPYKVDKIYLAGFDGYSHDSEENYRNEECAIISRNTVLDAMNQGMSNEFALLSKDIELVFLTTPRHVVF